MTSTCSKENKTNYKKYSSTYLSMHYPCIYINPERRKKTIRKKIVKWNVPLPGFEPGTFCSLVKHHTTEKHINTEFKKSVYTLHNTLQLLFFFTDKVFALT